MSSLSPILANMPPPQLRVQIPAGREEWHEIAGPLFLSLAVAFAGLWLIRSRSLKSTFGRTMLIASIGSLALSYSAWWIWANRDVGIAERHLGAVLAVEMPWLLALIGVLAVILSPLYPGLKNHAELWPICSLVGALFVGTIYGFVMGVSVGMLMPVVVLGWFVITLLWGIGISIATSRRRAQAKN